MKKEAGKNLRKISTGPSKGKQLATQARAEVEHTPNFPLARLHLDGNNPRLGARAGQFANETEILNAIVDVFGVDDVLSSLAVNGYFEAEPMVGVRIGKTDDIKIAEGNRRLAACLILIGDPRARNQKKRTEDYQALQQKHKRAAITNVPVRVLTDTYCTESLFY